MAAYSERHQVPTIQEFREIERQREAAAEANESELPQSAEQESSSGAAAAPPLPVKDHAQSPPTPSKSKGETHAPRKSRTGASQQAESADDTDEEDVDNIPRDADDADAPHTGEEEKQRLKSAAGPKDKPSNFQAKGTRKVKDPVTGGDVIIRDSAKKAKIDPKKLDSRYEGGFSSNVIPSAMQHAESGYGTKEGGGEKTATAAGTGAKRPKALSALDEIHTNPGGTQPSNLLLYPFPPPATTSPTLEKLKGTFKQLALALTVALGVAWFFVAFGAGYTRFLFRTVLLGGIGVGGAAALGIAERKIEKALLDIQMDMHQQRGERFSPPMPESVEWLNAAIATIWKQIDPAMFIPIADQVEDVMQQSLPGFIDAVKVDDIGIGENAFRFIAFRGLSDLMTDPKYPREEWITQGKKQEEIYPEKFKEGGEKAKEGGASVDVKKVEGDADGDGIADEDESGDFLNYEISFSYSARPALRARTTST